MLLLNDVSNQRVLQVIAICFLLFVIAEAVGAAISHSLSLAGDAAAMSIDVFSYIVNMGAEYCKGNPIIIPLKSTSYSLL